MGKERLVFLLDPESYHRMFYGDKVDRIIGKKELKMVATTIAQNEGIQPGEHLEIGVTQTDPAILEGRKFRYFFEPIVK